MAKPKESTFVSSEKISDSREEFRVYFVGLKKKLNLAPELENIIWLHLKAVGMDKKDQFSAGVNHFGYKI